MPVLVSLQSRVSGSGAQSHRTIANTYVKYLDRGPRNSARPPHTAAQRTSTELNFSNSVLI